MHVAVPMPTSVRHWMLKSSRAASPAADWGAFGPEAYAAVAGRGLDAEIEDAAAVLKEAGDFDHGGSLGGAPVKDKSP